MFKLLLVGLYLGLGLVYIILTGVDLPGKIDDFLHKHHSISYMIIGSLYVSIALTKIFEFKAKGDNAEKSNFFANLFSFSPEGEDIAILVIVLFTLYCWKKLLYGKKIAGHRII